MKRSLLLLVIVLFSGFIVTAQDDFPRTLVDALGNEVRIEAPPQRIVSASLAIDEILLPLVGAERLLAITALASDPGISNVAVQAGEVQQRIASRNDTEQIIVLEPDIVFIDRFTTPEVVQQLQDAGIPLFTMDFAASLDAVRANIRLLGQAVGEDDAAEGLIAAMDADIQAVSDAVGEVETPVRALFLTPGNYTSGVDSTISQIIAAAGGVDVAAEAGLEQFAAVSDEFIIEQDPDVILLAGWTPYDPTFVDTMLNNPAFANLSAIQNGRVYIANDAHLTSISHFIAEGVKDVAAYLYPSLYPDYPLTVTDATGEDVVVASEPGGVVVVGEATMQALTLLVDEMEENPFDIINADLEDATIGGAGDVVVFAPLPADDLPGVEGADSVTYVRVYDGDSPAEVVANLEIMGDALDARVAALDTVATYTDMLEAQAAS